ncbi:MAG: hypothetical protein ACC652_04180, partial [Acidimicrobiales bacterium]
MKHKLLTSTAGLFAALIVVGASIAITQQPVAEIEMVSWSPQEIADAGLESHKSAGLSVVGVEELVYVRGIDTEGGEITAFAWSIVSTPDGSVATFD